MKLLFKVYDSSRHCYLTDEEVRVAPSGKVWLNMATAPFEDWREVADAVEDIMIEQVTIGEQTHVDTD